MTRLNFRTNALYALGAVLLAALLYSMLWIGKAHADTGTPVIVAAPTEQPLAAYIAIVLAGIATIISVLHAGLAWLAPRTETKLDDKLRDELAEVLAFIRGPQPPPVTVNVAPPTSPTSGILPLLAVFLIGLSAASQVACSTWRDRTAAGVGTFLSCEAPHVDANLLEEAKKLAIAAVEKWISGDGHVDRAGLKSAAAPLKSDLMRCAFDGAIAALATPTAKQPDAPMAAGFEVRGDELQAAAAIVRAELGWPAQKGGV